MTVRVAAHVDGFNLYNGLHTATVRRGDEVAAQILAEPAWPALAAQLRRLEHGGNDAGRVLADAAAGRELGSARSVAATLQHRLVRAAGQPTAETTRRQPPVSQEQPDRGRPVPPGRGRGRGR